MCLYFQTDNHLDLCLSALHHKKLANVVTPIKISLLSNEASPIKKNEAFEFQVNKIQNEDCCTREFLPNNYLAFGEDILELKIPVSIKETGKLDAFVYWFTLATAEVNISENTVSDNVIDPEFSLGLSLNKDYEEYVTNQCALMNHDSYKVTEKETVLIKVLWRDFCFNVIIDE